MKIRAMVLVSTILIPLYCSASDAPADTDADIVVTAPREEGLTRDAEPSQRAVCRFLNLRYNSRSVGGHYRSATKRASITEIEDSKDVSQIYPSGVSGPRDV
jgi:hypothetical protein